MNVNIILDDIVKSGSVVLSVMSDGEYMGRSFVKMFPNVNLSLLVIRITGVGREPKYNGEVWHCAISLCETLKMKLCKNIIHIATYLDLPKCVAYAQQELTPLMCLNVYQDTLKYYFLQPLPSSHNSEIQEYTIVALPWYFFNMPLLLIDDIPTSKCWFETWHAV